MRSLPGKRRWRVADGLLQPLDDYRVAGWVRVESKGRPVNVYVAHLNFTDTSGAVRAKQLSDLLSLVEATRGDAPVVIGGDFNTTANSDELAGLRARYFDAYAVAKGVAISDGSADVTLNPHFHAQAQRIDHVFAQTGAFRAVQARRMLDEPSPGPHWASDHFGVWVRLRFAAN
jgi:endonuclease/exonuclease/phosphatase family metal-dependent hydrolase